MATMRWKLKKKERKEEVWDKRKKEGRKAKL